MSKYNLHCFDLMGACVCRGDFDADNNAEARTMAGAICDACADEHHSYELWKGDLPIGSGETLAGAFNTGLSQRARKIVLNHMIALSHSAWPVGRSHRMRDRIAAWARDLESIPAGKDDNSPMRQFRRGVKFFRALAGRHALDLDGKSQDRAGRAAAGDRQMARGWLR